MIFKEICKEQIKELASMYMDAFNSPPWNDKWSIESSTTRLSQMIYTLGFYGMSCYDDNSLIGMILGHSECYYDGTYFQITEFFIDINHRGKGIGSLLLNTFLEKLREQNKSKVFLVTSRTSETEGFYKKSGFISIENMVMMNKSLN